VSVIPSGEFSNHSASSLSASAVDFGALPGLARSSMFEALVCIHRS
jgi:hypothetical protein